jgi:O-antigen/teichoic acid export membrane protein
VNREVLSHFVRDAGHYMPANVVPAACSIASVSIFTRMFEAGDYGRYSLALVVATLLATVLASWLEQSVLRYQPRLVSEGREAEFFSWVSALLGTTVLAVALAGALIALAARPHLGPGAYLAAPTVALLAVDVTQRVLSVSLQSERRSRALSAYRSTAAALRVLFSLGIVAFLWRDVAGLLLGAIAGYTVLGIWLVPKVLRRPSGLALPRFAGAPLRQFAAYGLPFVGVALCSQLLALSDRLALGVFRASDEVGIYSANAGLVTMGFSLITVPLLMAAQPLIVHSWEVGARGELPGLVRAFSRLFLAVGGAVVALVGAQSEALTAVLLGPEFRSGHLVIPILLAGSLAWGLGTYGVKGFELRERTGLMLGIAASCTVVNLIGNVALVPRFGFMAAAWVMLGSHALYPALVYTVAPRVLRWELPFGSLARVLLAGALGAAAARVGHAFAPAANPWLELILGSALGSLAYAACLLASGELRGLELLRARST